VRKQSTETGEDSTGHISAHPNEGILFFDSKNLGYSMRFLKLMSHRPLSPEASLDSSIALPRRQESVRSTDPLQ
jgi:hypothetical protein